MEFYLSKKYILCIICSLYDFGISFSWCNWYNHSIIRTMTAQLSLRTATLSLRTATLSLRTATLSSILVRNCQKKPPSRFQIKKLMVEVNKCDERIEQYIKIITNHSSSVRKRTQVTQLYRWSWDGSKPYLISYNSKNK